MEHITFSKHVVRLPRSAREALQNPARVIVFLYQNDVCICAGRNHKINHEGILFIREGKLHFKRGTFPWEIDTTHGVTMLVVKDAGVRFQKDPLVLDGKRMRKIDQKRVSRTPRTRSQSPATPHEDDKGP